MDCISTHLSSFKFSLRSIILAILFSAVFCELSFSNQVFALFTPTLSASVDQTNLQVNGNQVINSTNKTIDIPFNLIVNTNNRTGYTVAVNSETDNTALVNSESSTGSKINSIGRRSAYPSVGYLPNNTWAFRVTAYGAYYPIPALSEPMQIIQTTEKTNGNESNRLSIGMKLADNLESGRYTNKLIFSILTNNYDHIAIMTEGPDFNTKLKSLETATSKIKYFKKSTVVPATSMNAVNIDDEESDYEIKLWLDPTDKTAYYYTEPEKVYLNTDSHKMFYSGYGNVRNILDLDLSSFDTSKVTDMSFMFTGMSSLTSLNLSSFDTSRVTDMSYMLADMYDLITLNLSNFDTSKVTNMNAMLYNLFKLTTLNLSSFDTSKVTNMRYMFYGMSNLTTLNLSSFDTSKVTNMSNMFDGMSNLITLDLSSFNTSQVTDMGYMFSLEDGDRLKDKLEKIYVNNDFNTTKLTNFSGMFRNRKKLRGGNGSYLADPSTADRSWLRVDRPGVQGYFTRKP